MRTSLRATTSAPPDATVSAAGVLATTARPSIDRTAPPVRPLPSAEEQLLIAAAHRGDRAAFQTIVERHQGAVYGYLRSRLFEPADAEDLTQEVFLRSYVGHTRFEGTIMIRPWLLGIARNLLREHARKVQRRKEVAWTEPLLAAGRGSAGPRNPHVRRRDGSPADVPGRVGSKRPPGTRLAVPGPFAAGRNRREAAPQRGSRQAADVPCPAGLETLPRLQDSGLRA